MNDMFLACRNVDPEIFFQPLTTGRAISLCMKCPALESCREVIRGIEQSIGRQDGVWAGLSVEMRRREWPCIV